jgi:hypothetical protein
MPRFAFDDLSKAVASGATRRSLLRRLIGAAAGAVALTGRDASVQHGGQVGICHKSWAWSSDWRYITVDVGDERRIEAHLEHGDTVDPDFSSDPNHCGECGNLCAAPENGTAWCAGGGCDFSCNDGYQWDGSACVPVGPTLSLEFLWDGSSGIFTGAITGSGLQPGASVTVTAVFADGATFIVEEGPVSDAGTVSDELGTTTCNSARDNPRHHISSLVLESTAQGGAPIQVTYTNVPC